MILLPKPSQGLPHVSLLEPKQALWIVEFLGCFQIVQSSWCRELCEWRLIWPYYARISSCLMSRFYGCDTISYASEHYFQ
jgi:hypothetical protein